MRQQTYEFEGNRGYGGCTVAHLARCGYGAGRVALRAAGGLMDRSGRRRTGWLWPLAAVLVVAGCSDDSAPTTTAALPSTTSAVTTSTVAATTSTTTRPPTTTVSADARLAEIQAIVHDVEVRRLSAIYDEDADALWAAVATKDAYEAGIESMGALPFIAEPTAETVVLSVEEVLLDRDDCIVVDATEDGSTLFEGSPTSRDVIVLWPHDVDGWRLATVWASGTPDSVWVDDCDLLDRTWTP